ncbi:MFS transporter, partial [Salmonella enterica subsp. enterica serovar Javiana]|uniref:MFS transporter n=1 Tax=Salmonella enterica TaxID=28901 RepID=UPI001C58CE15
LNTTMSASIPDSYTHLMPPTISREPRSLARLGAARSIAASLTFVCLAFLIGPRITHSIPTEMASVYLFCTIILVSAGLQLDFIFLKSARDNLVPIFPHPPFIVSRQPPKQSRPLMMLCTCALFILISTVAVSASSLFYVRYVLNDTALFSVIVLVQMLVGSVASAPLVPRLVAKIGKKNTFLAGALMGTLGDLVFFFLADHSVPAGF